MLIAVLQQLHPAQVIAARHAGPVHGQAQFLPVTVLDKDAGHVAQHVAQGVGQRATSEASANAPPVWMRA